MYCNSTCLSTIENQQKLFIFVNNPAENLTAARMTCKEKYNATLASHLLPDDYVNLNNCCDVTQRSFRYRIGLLSNRDLVCKNGVNTTFHWTRVNNEARSCITGEPLLLETPPTKYCHSVEIVLGSKVENVFNNSRWSKCKDKSGFICQKVSQISAPAKSNNNLNSTIVPVDKSSSFAFNSGAVVAGAIATFCVIFFLFLFFLLYRKKKRRKTRFGFQSSTSSWSFTRRTRNTCSSPDRIESRYRCGLQADYIPNSQ